MSSIDVSQIILQHFPKAADCINGHIGEEVESIEQELADDRYYEIKVVRCGHCNIPLREDYV
jgi:hypothetical protein